MDPEVDAQDLDGTGEPNADLPEIVEPLKEHPAWQEILDVLPDEFRSIVTPTLRKWDDGVTERLQKIQAEYEPYEQFREYDPQVIDQGVQLLQKLNEDPIGVLTAMQEAFGMNQTTENEGELEFEPSEEFGQITDPRVDALQAQLETLLAQQQMQQQAIQDAQEAEQLDTYLQGLANEFGSYDEDFVIPLMANGVPGEEAVKRYQELIGAQAQDAANANAPRVIGGGTNSPPADVPDFNTMSGTDVKDMVAQMLANANKDT